MQPDDELDGRGTNGEWDELVTAMKRVGYGWDTYEEFLASSFVGFAPAPFDDWPPRAE